MSITHIAFYPSDWLSGTRSLSAEETGVYITLISQMYEMAGSIKRDDKRLSRLCGCKSKTSFVNALDFLIEEGKIQESEDGLSNERVQKEIEKATSKSSQAKRACDARWAKKSNKNNGTTNTDAIRGGYYPEPEPEPDIDDDDKAREKIEIENPKNDLTFRERILEAMRHDRSGMTATGKLVGSNSDLMEANRWEEDLQLSKPEILDVIADVMLRKQGAPPASFKYFTKAMQEFSGQKQQAALTPITTATNSNKVTPFETKQEQQQRINHDKLKQRVTSAAERVYNRTWGHS